MKLWWHWQLSFLFEGTNFFLLFQIFSLSICTCLSYNLWFFFFFNLFNQWVGFIHYFCLEFHIGFYSNLCVFDIWRSKSWNWWMSVKIQNCWYESHCLIMIAFVPTQLKWMWFSKVWLGAMIRGSSDTKSNSMGHNCLQLLTLELYHFRLSLSLTQLLLCITDIRPHKYLRKKNC